MRDIGHPFDIDDFQGRIRRCLEKGDFGFRPHRCAPGGEVGAIDDRVGYTKPHQHILDHITNGAEEGPSGDHVITRLETAEERRAYRSHPGRGRAADWSALEKRHPLLEYRDGWIGIARVGITRRAFETLLGFLWPLIGIARG